MTARALGYLVQCEVCPQQAMLDEYMEGWLCPRCAEVAEPEPAYAAFDSPYDFKWRPVVYTDQVVAVQLSDGTIRTEYRDASPADLQRAHDAIVAAWAAVAVLAGLGDAAAEQAEPVGQMTVSVEPCIDPVRVPQFTHYPWGEPTAAEESELPYKPPAALADDDEPDFGHIQI